MAPGRRRTRGLPFVSSSFSKEHTYPWGSSAPIVTRTETKLEGTAVTRGSGKGRSSRRNCGYRLELRQMSFTMHLRSTWRKL